MKTKGSPGDAETEPGASSEGNHNDDTADDSVFGDGRYAQEIAKLRRENKGYRTKLREAEKTAEQASQRVETLQSQLVGDRISASLRIHGIDPEDNEAAFKRLTKLAQTELDVSWGEDGVTLEADVETTVTGALKDLGFIKEAKDDEQDAPKQDEPKEPEKAPEAPAQPGTISIANLVQKPQNTSDAGQQTNSQALSGPDLIHHLLARAGEGDGL